MDTASALRATRRGLFFVVLGAMATATAAPILTTSSEPGYTATSTYRRPVEAG